jgi:hypothetical protein
MRDRDLGGGFVTSCKVNWRNIPITLIERGRTGFQGKMDEQTAQVCDIA